MTDPLFVDVYELDGPKDWHAFVAAGAPWHGAIFKLTQGLYYQARAWARAQREAFVDHERYGVDLWDGFYHYLDVGQDGATQAEWFWQQMTLVGGEKIGTLWGMVDVERGGQRSALTKPRVEDCLFAFAARYEQLSGRKATLYGGELLRAIGARGLYGCGRSAIALYNGTLPRDVVERTGTDYEHLAFWQYSGTEEHSRLAGYPDVAPGCGKVDISALVLPGGLDTIRRTLWAERP